MNRPPVVQLFYNPHAGTHSVRGLRELVAAFEAEGACVMPSPSIDHVPEIAEQTTHVCIAGGDGTVRHVASAMVHAMAGNGITIPAAIYPFGTVNLLAREDPVSRTPAEFAYRLLHGGSSRPHHPVTIGDTMFFACASIGPDSLIVSRVSQQLKHRLGRLAYVTAFVRLIWNWPRPRLRLRANGRTLDCEAVFIAKAHYYAGPWSFAPAARVTDRLLHVVALRRARRRDFLRFAWAMLRGRDPAALDGVTGFTCTRLAIDCADGIPVQADGDIVAHGPVELAIHDTAVLFR